MTREWPRNLVSAGIVLVLHACFILALIAAMYHAPAIAPVRLYDVLLRLPPQRSKYRPPLWAEPSRTLAAPQIPVPDIEIAPAAPETSTLEGIGQALSGCDIDNAAPPEPGQHTPCQQLTFGQPQEPSLRLGPIDVNSPYAKALAKRDAPVAPMEHACTTLESPSANLGLPCYSFPSGTITGLGRQ